MSSTEVNKSPSIVIVGGGIIGASVAYYFAERNVSVTTFEATGVASSSSGKAGGFLASDWSAPPLNALSSLSFDLHRHLALNEFDADSLGYRVVSAYSIDLHRGKGVKGKWGWLDGDLQPRSKPSQIGDQRKCAQVTPFQLTHALFDKAREKVGSKVVLGHVTNVRRSGDDGKSNKTRWEIEVDVPVSVGSGSSDGKLDMAQERERRKYKADIVVLCMGAWSIKACEWFPSLAPIAASKAASLIVHRRRSNSDSDSNKPNRTDSDETSTKQQNEIDRVLFSQYTYRRGQVREPEVYPRPNGDVYVCQSAVPDDLPIFSSDIRIDKRD